MTFALLGIALVLGGASCKGEIVDAELYPHFRELIDDPMSFDGKFVEVRAYLRDHGQYILFADREAAASRPLDDIIRVYDPPVEMRLYRAGCKSGDVVISGRFSARWDVAGRQVIAPTITDVAWIRQESDGEYCWVRD